MSKLIKNEDALISEILKIEYISEIWDMELERRHYDLQLEE